MRKTLLVLAASWLGLVGFSPSLVSAQDSNPGVHFVDDVVPILKRNCDRCHGDVNQESGLSLSRPAAFQSLEQGGKEVVRPGEPDASALFQRITDPSHGDLMPLDGDPLTADETETIRKWIAAGAVIPADWSPGQHWAYLPPDRHGVPPETVGEGKHPIDRWVALRRQRRGLSPQPLADPATLARRVSLALTGLPPTLEQVDTLVANPDDEHYRKLVDQLLDSTAFGQHWARHWLDLARYADSNGFQADQLRDSWAYRDWVVDALNDDLPFDQFVIQQLAGDLLPDATDATRIATGFHRTTICNVEAGVDPEANRINQVLDRVNTTATVFLGTTLECAQCHDHKYDPFTQREYYQLFAYFNNTPMEVEKKAGVRFDFRGPSIDLPLTEEQRAQRRRWIAERERLQRRRDDLVSGESFESWLESTRAALKQGRARWIVPRPRFTADGIASFEIREDNSVLIAGDLPGSVNYRFNYQLEGQTVLGVRIDALRDESLPGGGPGAGDAQRTNFVLHELELSLDSADASRPIDLDRGEASFSQSQWDVAGAVDGDRATGWAIAPRFDQAHWAEFRAVSPCTPAADETLTVTLDQHFGRGRVIGRPKISFLVGPPETVGLDDTLIALLQRPEPDESEWQQLRQFHAQSNPEIESVDRKLAALTKKIDGIQPPKTLVMVERPEPRTTALMQRGDYRSPGEEVQPGTPEVLHPMAAGLPENRLGLARWLVDTENPLLARVTVNRFWGQLFGRGIVATPEDFGTQAEPPTHPELLDWLAVEFQQQGWSVKQLLKTIVLSRTFRQRSAASEQQLEIDPENRWLARGPRYRLSAETIRDNALAIAGLLNRETGGAPVMPYQPDGIWRSVGRNQPKWVVERDQERFRRGLYVVWKRAAPYPSFTTFDAPDRTSCTVQRPRTNTPLQALVLLNDRAYAEAAVGLAQRMMTEPQVDDPAGRAAWAYRVATSQTADASTRRLLVELYRAEREWLQDHPEIASERIQVLPEPFRNRQLDPIECGAWYAVANALLNLDRTITIN